MTVGAALGGGGFSVPFDFVANFGEEFDETRARDIYCDLVGRGRTGGYPPILPFETGLATFTASGYWVIGPCHG